MKDDLSQQLAASLKVDGPILRGDLSPHADPHQPGFEQRAARGNNDDLAKILSNVPDAPPAPGDELFTSMFNVGRSMFDVPTPLNTRRC